MPLTYFKNAVVSRRTFTNKIFGKLPPEKADMYRR
jgi:hypothetical protein